MKAVLVTATAAGLGAALAQRLNACGERLMGEPLRRRVVPTTQRLAQKKFAHDRQAR